MSDAPTVSEDLYTATIKHFGSQPEPPFEDAERLTRLWGRNWGCDNDVGRLRAVLMHRPGAEFDVIDRSRRINETGTFGDIEAGWYWQSDEIPELHELQAQHDGLADLLRAEGVEVHYVDRVEGGRFKTVYTRDSAIAVKGGAIVSRMAPRMRHGEEQAIARTLANLGMPILRTLNGSAMSEGGSFAWLNPQTAVIGRGIRVNDQGIEQIADVLRHQGAELLVVDLCGYSIHIDGAMVMVDRDLALVDPRQLPYVFLQRLNAMGIETVEVSADDNGWIINGLAIAPRRMIIPRGISEATREALASRGVTLLEIDYDRVQLNGGGVHCSTCPLIRDPV
ncbi:N-Dimethylarginine dimethylaminohydrolase [Albimonas donghaensis]|uniref:arginine deiminase n=1 Tax=Albimonas donghaensis TaxID=356660 RepID=A0A1H2TJT1_9RHOB|nr:arginine deiminase family protein [Albimonas donghaensis]SDW44256.1 N-Dimethylarginine dimethylaminohydrolase [Albimonas donghaensis]